MPSSFILQIYSNLTPPGSASITATLPTAAAEVTAGCVT